jgi:hypothetical protein
MRAAMRNRRYTWVALALAVCASAARAEGDRAVQTFERLGATITRDETRQNKPVVAVTFGDLAKEDPVSDLFREFDLPRSAFRPPVSR